MTQTIFPEFHRVLRVLNGRNFPFHSARPCPQIAPRLLLLLAVLLLAGGAAAQRPVIAGRARIVIIKTRDVPFYTAAQQGFVNGLKQRGYRGEKVEIKTVSLTGNAKSDLALTQEQIRKRPNLLVTLGTDATRLVVEQKSDIPTLFSAVLDPVSMGAAKSLEEPGGVFTGTTLLVSPGKQFDALLQSCPKARRIGVLYTENDSTSLAYLKEAQADAKRLGLEVRAVAVKPDQASKAALAGMAGAVDALWLIPDPASTGVQEMTDTLEFARVHKLPILGASSATVRAGALTALSANLEDLGDLTAEMAVRILEGTDSPAKMRARGPRRTQLTLNLDVARLLNIALPDALLSLADEVYDSRKDGAE